MDEIVIALTMRRLQRGVTQEALAEVMGTSKAAISKLERGINSPAIHRVRMWAEALEMELLLREVNSATSAEGVGPVRGRTQDQVADPIGCFDSARVRPFFG